MRSQWRQVAETPVSSTGSVLDQYPS